MQIFVKLTVGRAVTLTFDVEPSDTVGSVKVRIMRAQGLSPDQQRLLYTGKPLQDDRTLLDYGIPRDTTLQLVVLSAPAAPVEPGRLCLPVRMIDGGQVVLECLLTDSVLALKRRLHDAHADAYAFSFSGRILNDKETVEGACLLDGPGLYVVRAPVERVESDDDDDDDDDDDRDGDGGEDDDEADEEVDEGEGGGDADEGDEEVDEGERGKEAEPVEPSPAAVPVQAIHIAVIFRFQRNQNLYELTRHCLCSEPFLIIRTRLATYFDIPLDLLYLLSENGTVLEDFDTPAELGITDGSLVIMLLAEPQSEATTSSRAGHSVPEVGIARGFASFAAAPSFCKPSTLCDFAMAALRLCHINLVFRTALKVVPDVACSTVTPSPRDCLRAYLQQLAEELASTTARVHAVNTACGRLPPRLELSVVTVSALISSTKAACERQADLQRSKAARVEKCALKVLDDALDTASVSLDQTRAMLQLILARCDNSLIDTDDAASCKPHLVDSLLLRRERPSVAQFADAPTVLCDTSRVLPLLSRTRTPPPTPSVTVFSTLSVRASSLPLSCCVGSAGIEATVEAHAGLAGYVPGRTNRFALSLNELAGGGRCARWVSPQDVTVHISGLTAPAAAPARLGAQGTVTTAHAEILPVERLSHNFMGGDPTVHELLVGAASESGGGAGAKANAGAGATAACGGAGAADALAPVRGSGGGCSHAGVRVSVRVPRPGWVDVEYDGLSWECCAATVVLRVCGVVVRVNHDSDVTLKRVRAPSAVPSSSTPALLRGSSLPALPTQASRGPVAPKLAYSTSHTGTGASPTVTIRASARSSGCGVPVGVEGSQRGIQLGLTLDDGDAAHNTRSQQTVAPSNTSWQVGSSVWTVPRAGVGAQLHTLLVSGAGPCIALRQDQTCAVAASGHTVTLYSLPQGLPVHAFGELGGGTPVVPRPQVSGAEAGRYYRPPVLLFSSIRSVCFAPNGNILVADAGNKRVQEVTSRGAFVRLLGAGVLTGVPFAVACGGDTVAVGQWGLSMQRVMTFSWSTGLVLGMCGGADTPQSLRSDDCTCVCVSPDGSHFAVGEHGFHQRVVLFTAAGVFVRSLRLAALGVGVKTAAFAGDGALVLADARSNRVCVLDVETGLLLHVLHGAPPTDKRSGSGSGSGSGTMAIESAEVAAVQAADDVCSGLYSYPRAVACAGQLLLVADSSDRVQLLLLTL